jgi:hypothetical protein
MSVTSTSSLELALIAAAKATDANGRRIVLFNYFGVREDTLSQLGSRVLNRINELTDGIPMNFDCSPGETYRSHARNLQLLIDIYKKWAEVIDPLRPKPDHSEEIRENRRELRNMLRALQEGKPLFPPKIEAMILALEDGLL